MGDSGRAIGISDFLRSSPAVKIGVDGEGLIKKKPKSANKMMGESKVLLPRVYIDQDGNLRQNLQREELVVKKEERETLRATSEQSRAQSNVQRSMQNTAAAMDSPRLMVNGDDGRTTLIRNSINSNKKVLESDFINEGGSEVSMET